MKGLTRIAAAALVMAATLAHPQQEPEEVDVRPATRAADAWLELVDAGRYGASWDAAAATFQDAIERVKWETTVDDVRGKLGLVAKRKLRAARHARSLPNSPEGEYVVIENVTNFENRPLSTETVTLMKQKDGSWKVAGYFIH
jgi:hypothetical protein